MGANASDTIPEDGTVNCSTLVAVDAGYGAAETPANEKPTKSGSGAR